jgi:hypothetical protein
LRYKKKSSHTNHQAKNIDVGENLVFEKTAIGDSKVVFEHNHLGLATTFAKTMPVGGHAKFI